jgi:Lrp/AsnC family transcriptional regulator, leucine-responsive regulatory protein
MSSFRLTPARAFFPLDTRLKRRIYAPRPGDRVLASAPGFKDLAMTNSTLDALDRRILLALQEDNQISADLLGERVGLSASAAQRRAKRLRNEKVIMRDTSVVDPKAVGQNAMFIVEVCLERENTDVVTAFKQRMRTAPEVQQCYYTTGDADFIVVIVGRSLEDYNELIDRLFVQDKNIRKFKTSVVLSRVKATLAVPIDDVDPAPRESSPEP